MAEQAYGKDTRGKKETGIDHKRAMGEIVSRGAKTAASVTASGKAMTPGGLAKKVTEAVANPYLEQAAERLVQARKKTQERTLTQKKERVAGTATDTGEEKKKMTGPAFWMIVCVALIKDISDVFANITLVLAIFVIVTGILVNFIIFFYLFSSGVRPSARKLATLMFSFIIGIVPFLSILPETTLALFIVRAIENSEHLKKIAERKGKLSARSA